MINRKSCLAFIEGLLINLRDEIWQRQTMDDETFSKWWRKCMNAGAALVDDESEED